MQMAFLAGYGDTNVVKVKATVWLKEGRPLHSCAADCFVTMEKLKRCRFFEQLVSILSNKSKLGFMAVTL